MAKVNGITVKFGDLHGFKLNRRGLADANSTQQMQSHLVGVASGIAAKLNASEDGTYDVGPVGEPVYSNAHPYPLGAHAFVRTADQVARIEQASWNTLGNAVGG